MCEMSQNLISHSVANVSDSGKQTRCWELSRFYHQ